MKFSKFNLIYPNGENYLLVNTLTGSLLEIDSDYKRIVENKQIQLLTEEDIILYRNTGIIVEKRIDENRILKYFMNKEKYCSKVLSLTVLLTWACNFACPYCFEGNKTKGTPIISAEIKSAIKKFIKNMFEINGNLSMVSITLFGGEPLIGFDKNIEWLKEIKELCEVEGKKFVTSIITNGSLINEQYMHWLTELNCEYIQITLDGYKQEHDKRRVKKNGEGTFKEVITGIKLAIASETIIPLIRINIDKSNLYNIDELLIFLKREGLNVCPIDFGIIRSDNSSISAYDADCIQENEIGEILEKLWYKLKELEFPIQVNPKRRNLYCGLLSDTAFTITPDGELYKCWEYLDDKNFYLGQLSEKGDVDNYDYNLVDWMTKDFYENDDCCVCEYLPVCGGGCAAVSYDHYSNVHESGCFKSKSLFEAELKFYYKNVMNNIH